MRFFDADEGAAGTQYEITSDNLEWAKKVPGDAWTPGWMVLCRDVADESDSAECVGYHINSTLHDMIADARTKHGALVELVKPPVAAAAAAAAAAASG